ncbi:MAG: hypothetical protein K9W44_13660 [Candidatus Lokiarchaeota archaeon]|nr:hypothetical protein [Candidatus Harpocratesius repetitus]
MKKKNNIFWFLIFSSFLILSVSTQIQPIVATSMSKEPLLKVNPIVVSFPKVLTTGNQFNLDIGPDGYRYVVSVDYDYFLHYLTLSTYDSEWRLINSQIIFNRSESLSNPKIQIGSHGSIQILVGVENVGYFYLFSNHSEWLQTLICPSNLLNINLHFEIDELNQPHIAWLNSTNLENPYLEYMYPAYSFMHQTQINATYFNSTLMNQTVSYESEIKFEFASNRTVFSEGIIPIDFTLSLENYHQTKFLLQTDYTPPQDNSSIFHRLEMLEYTTLYTRSNFNQSSLIESNFTNSENFTTNVYQWFNTTTFYTNLTAGQFHNFSLLVNTSTAESLQFPHFITDSLNNSHIFWLQKNNLSTWGLNYLKLDSSSNLIQNISFNGEVFQILNSTLVVEKKYAFLPGISEIFEGLVIGKSPSNSICLIYFHLTSTTFAIEPIYTFSSQNSLASANQYKYIPNPKMIVVPKWDLFDYSYHYLLFLQNKSRFANAYNFISQLNYISKSIPSRFNSSINANYSSIVVSDKQTLSLEVGVGNFYLENQTCNLTLKIIGQNIKLSKENPTNQTILSLHNGTMEYLEWNFQFLEEDNFERFIAIDIYSNGQYIGRFGFYVIVIPGINVVNLGFYIIGLIGFSTVFFLYKKIR